MIDKIEIWKDIPGYKGFYQASSLGRIKSIDRVTYQYNHKPCVPHHRKGKILKFYKNKKGYFISILSKNGKCKWFGVHRLVAYAFIGISDKTVHHKDWDKQNNIPENLEFLTPTQHSSGEMSGNCKISDADVINMREDYQLGKYSERKLARKYNIGKSQAHNILSNQQRN